MKIPDDATSYVPNDNISETFINSIGSTVISDGIAQLELCIIRTPTFDPNNPPVKVKFPKHPVCRLVMPVATLADLFNSIQKLRDAYEAEQRRTKGPQSN